LPDDRPYDTRQRPAFHGCFPIEKLQGRPQNSVGSLRGAELRRWPLLMLVVALVNIQHHNTNGIEKLSYPEII
jgi:hypothetical protein